MNDLKKYIELHQAGDLDAAEQGYSTLLAANPKDAQICQLLGPLCAQTHRHEAAVSLLKRYVLQMPGQAMVHNNLANSLKRLGQIAESQSHYERAIEHDRTYVAAYRNLANLLAGTGKQVEAQEVINRGLARVPNEPSLLTLKGDIISQTGSYVDAINCYLSSLQFRPDHPPTRLSLGVAYRLNNQPAKALEHYHYLQSLGINAFELFQNMGNAHSDLGEFAEALNCYRQVLALNPEYVDAHRNISDIEWSLGHRDALVASYDDAARIGINTSELNMAKAETLLAAEQADEALVCLKEFSASESAARLALEASCLTAKGDFAEAIVRHEQAQQSDDSDSTLWATHFGMTLLQAGDAERARTVLEPLVAQQPLNQLARSHLTLALRMTGDPSAKGMTDYKNLVRTYTIATPDGYGSLEEFNAALLDVLQALHTSKYHPYQQTLRGGTQTQGNLFGRGIPEVEQLANAVSDCVRQHLAHLKTIELPFPDFPTPADFAFNASWSVRLQAQGFHNMHMHPMGWYSSAYYVDLPPGVDDNSDAGWLKFGQPNFPSDLEPELKVKPVAGNLTLFPSYLWHGTVPFEDTHPRTTVAFDVVPVNRSQTED